MARSKELVEGYLNQAQASLKSHVASLSKDKQDKKSLKHDPKWRQLNSAAKKLQRQIVFIDRRNAKPTPAGE